MITVADALALVSFTAEEKSRLAKLEARIDYELASRFDGAPMKLQFPDDQLSAKLWSALQRRYEHDGGWRVLTDAGAHSILFIPANTPVAGASSAAQPSLPPVSNTMRTEFALALEYNLPHLLVRMPTRGRPRQALEVLAKYRALAGMPITIEVVLDEDDETMMRAEVLQRLRALDCVITVGRHKSKVEAVNGGRVKDWDILLLASDDMVPVGEFYAITVRDELLSYFPNLDGCIYFDDGYQHENIVTLPIMGRRLYEQFGYVYHPSYKSLFCDQEQTDVLRKMNRLQYINTVLIEHRHHVTGKSQLDATYKRNDALWEADKAVYEARKARDFNYVQPLLSILICSVPERGALLDKLVDELDYQAERVNVGKVEIMVDARPSDSIGEKRQRLLERARGWYVCFIDDDDWVSHDYVSSICSAIYNCGEYVDTIAISGMMTTAGAAAEPFHNSIAHKEWYTKDGVHYRSPTHLSPVRRELALQAGFPNSSYGEDHDYSKALLPLLKSEAIAGDEPLYFYWYWPKSEKKEETK